MVDDRLKRRPRPAVPGQAKQSLTKVPRVPRACDNCRLRKSKCDGKVPCAFCTTHDFECVYDSTRPKRRLDSKYIQSLERDIARLKLALEASDSKKSEDASSEWSPTNAMDGSQLVGLPDPEAPADPSMLLETMVEATGFLDIDESGNCDYNGNSAGLVMLRRIRERCDALLQGIELPPTQTQSPKPTTHHPLTTPPATSPSSAASIRNRPNLPAREIGISYVETVLDFTTPFFQFLHRPTFSDRFERFYALRVNPDFEDQRFEALLYSIYALGELSSPKTVPETQIAGTPPLAELYFIAGHDLINLTDVCDLTSLQALLCMAVYLFHSGTLPKCYSYISLAVAACTRMGLHRADTSSKFNPIDREIRKRMFWCLRTLEIYVITVLGLPGFLSDDDIDQDFPEDIPDDLITVNGLLPHDRNPTCPMVAANAHAKLLVIMSKVKKFVLKGGKGEQGQRSGQYRVDYGRIVEIENELELWFSHLPKDTDFPQPIPPEIMRSQLLLRHIYAHVQMVLYRPFLHHIAKSRTDPDFDLRAFACASACINAAMQIIWIDEALNTKDLLRSISWFHLFVTLQATVCLVMFVLSNKGDDTAQECLRSAQRGYAILSKFAPSNRIAKEYTEFVEPLLERISLAQSSQTPTPPPSRPQMQRNQLNQLHRQISSSSFDKVLFNDGFLLSPPILSNTAAAAMSHAFDDGMNAQLEGHLQAMTYGPGIHFEHLSEKELLDPGSVTHPLF